MLACSFHIESLKLKLTVSFRLTKQDGVGTVVARTSCLQKRITFRTIPADPSRLPASADPGMCSLKSREAPERRRPNGSSDGQAKLADQRSSAHSPDQDALALQPLPQRAVALVSHRKDVRRDLAQAVAAVARHRLPVVQTRERLVRVHRRQDGADVGLRTEGGGGRQHAAPEATLAFELHQAQTGSKGTDIWTRLWCFHRGH